MSFPHIESKFQRKYNKWYKKLCENTWQYPREEKADKCKHCLRFKTEYGILPKLDNKTGIGPNKLTPTQIGFIAYHKYLPFDRKNSDNEKLQISHICGNVTNRKNSLCIEGSHMRLETKKQNLLRRKCHNYIRQFVNECKRFYDVLTVGTIKVIDVNNRLTLKNIKCLKKYDKRRYCKCKSKKCFINYGKITS